ncbi:hypothetical protein VTO73DRAFT_816 [Trametes versicolor]
MPVPASADILQNTRLPDPQPSPSANPWSRRSMIDITAPPLRLRSSAGASLEPRSRPPPSARTRACVCVVHARPPAHILSMRYIPTSAARTLRRARKCLNLDETTQSQVGQAATILIPITRLGGPPQSLDVP